MNTGLIRMYLLDPNQLLRRAKGTPHKASRPENISLPCDRAHPPGPVTVNI